MKPIVLALLSILFFNNATAQDSVYCGYTVDFQFETIRLKRNTDSILSITFFEETAFEPLKNSENYTLGFYRIDTLNNKYRIAKHWHTIGGGNTCTLMKPTTLYLYFKITSSNNRNEAYTYTKVVPVFFNALERNLEAWQLNNIDLGQQLQVNAQPIAIEVTGLNNYKIVPQANLLQRPSSLIELKELPKIERKN
ncbi:hypothetical protein [Winogradskyella forsetii]|uniref:hypothetical protein n=1 Tax=Winogradskyella forsetii TaxID=2686077 RepID=UPI0015B7E08D|nr:hypothetical protein [Winogradskyella forsetii]